MKAMVYEKGCIRCGLCADNCPAGAIKLENNVPQIDYDVCTNCGTCRDACPRKSLV